MSFMNCHINTYNYLLTWKNIVDNIVRTTNKIAVVITSTLELLLDMCCQTHPIDNMPNNKLSSTRVKLKNGDDGVAFVITDRRTHAYEEL